MNPTHRPSFYLALCFAAGIFLVQYLIIGLFAQIIILAACLLSAGIFFNHSIGKISIILSLIVLGMVYSTNYRHVSSEDIALLPWKKARGVERIEGRVVSEVESRKMQRGIKTSFELEIESLHEGNFQYKRKGKVLVNIFRKENIAFGDYLCIGGSLHRPFEIKGSGHFSYKDYLKRKGIYWMLSVGKDKAIERIDKNQGNFIKIRAMELRGKLKGILKKYLTPIEASIMQSFLLGGRSNIPDEIRELFVVTGTAHVLAISGQNITIISLVVFLLLKIWRVSRSAQFIFTVLFLAGYAFITGLSPSVVRATIMAIIFWMTFLFERDGDSLNSLGLAAFIILLMNPNNLFDIGFQLSFTGVLAIISLYPVTYSFFRGLLPEELPKIFVALLQGFSLSLAAWLGVFGFILYHFEVCTPVTILANLPVGPLMVALMILGMGLILTAGIAPPLALLLSYCIKIFLKMMVFVIYGLSQIPGGYFYLPKISVWAVVGYYVLFLSIFWFVQKTRRLQGKDYGLILEP